MQDVGSQGRTVLFVSHNMAAVSRLCERGILLNEGKLVDDGPIQDVIKTYMSSGSGTSAAREWPDLSEAPGGEISRLRGVRVVSKNGQVSEAVDIREPIGLQMEYDALSSGRMLLPQFYLHSSEGAVVFQTLDLDPEWRSRPRPEGHYVSTAWIPGNLLAEDSYFVTCGLMTLDPNIPQFIERFTVGFRIVDTTEGDSARGDWTGNMVGIIRPILDWDTEFTPVTVSQAL
jgi:lipopolysaccharide transport system ATP-binding protein